MADAEGLHLDPSDMLDIYSQAGLGAIWHLGELLAYTCTFEAPQWIVVNTADWHLLRLFSETKRESDVGMAHAGSTLRADGRIPDELKTATMRRHEVLYTEAEARQSRDVAGKDRLMRPYRQRPAA
jgi:hypothetical protein